MIIKKKPKYFHSPHRKNKLKIHQKTSNQMISIIRRLNGTIDLEYPIY